MESRNISIEVRYALAQAERFRGLAAELVGLGVDVIVVAGTLATRAAKEKTSTIPIVLVAVGDAVGAGLVKTLPRPGGNITGHSFFGPELALKGFDLLTEAIPRATRLAVLRDEHQAGRAGIGPHDILGRTHTDGLQRRLADREICPPAAIT